MNKITLITLLIALAINDQVNSSDSSKESESEELTTALNLLETSSTTLPSVSSTSRRTITQKELKDARKRRRKAMHMLSHSYERLYFKLSPETYEKMKKAADECNAQLKMNSDEVNICTERRLLWAPHRHGYRHGNRHNNVYHTSNSNSNTNSYKKNADVSKRGKSLDNEVIPGAIYEDEETTKTAETSSSTLETSPVSSSVTQQSTTNSKPTTSVALEIEQKIMSWRDVFGEEKSRVKCYVDKVKSSENSYRDLTREEWRETREELLIQLGNSVWQCIEDKLDQSSI